MSLLKKTEHTPYIWYDFYCPACKKSHPFYTSNPGRSEWTFNGNLEKPTFSPSLLVFPTEIQKRCHLNLTDGMIYYHGDSEHELAGKTVPMEPIKDEDVPAP